jgi:hypothetical protein
MAKTDYNSINFKNKDIDKFATKFNKTPEPPKKTEGKTTSVKAIEWKDSEKANFYKRPNSNAYDSVAVEKGRDSFMGSRGFKKTKEGNYINAKGEYGTPPPVHKSGEKSGAVNTKAEKKVVETVSKNVKNK